ncbi:MAG: hypothetical protein V1249_12225, partial [Acidimicrobiales bacterium]|nr:hypothetical protein [Acidimicrobiales bacterium]
MGHLRLGTALVPLLILAIACGSTQVAELPTPATTTAAPATTTSPPATTTAAPATTAPAAATSRSAPARQAPEPFLGAFMPALEVPGEHSLAYPQSLIDIGANAV